MDSVTLTIDGLPVTVAKGRTVLQAAIEAGIQVPYYCYHPGISVDGSCRVCIVKIEKMPKLQTSCSTLAAEGMVVQTRVPEVVEARAGVFEFLLANHPLDCPVCDKGGECPLQDFSYAFGPAQSRMDFPRRVFDGEGVKADVDFGPTLMLNRNRCILCTRCVRFMKEVDGDAQISIIDRGNGSEIATFQEQGVHSLLSGNLMDICPVGALLTRDYRFKSRPWDNPSVVDTICTSCSKGCSTSVWLKGKPEWAKGSQLARVTPRHNPAVNDYWMCDIGRFGYHWIEGAERLRRPLLKNGTALEPSSWQDAQARLRDRFGAVGAADPGAVRFLASAHASVEDLFVLRRLVQGLLGADGPSAVSIAWTDSPKPQPAESRFKIPSTDAPNVAGARDVGFDVSTADRGDTGLSRLRQVVESGRAKVVYVLDPGPSGSLGDVSWLAAARQSGALDLLVVQGVQLTPLASSADIVLPSAAAMEKDALYTNDQGSPQAASMVVAPPGEAQEDWRILTNLGRALGLDLAFTSSDDVRRAIALDLPNTPYAAIDRTVFVRPVSRKTWLQASNPSERWKWDVLYQDLPPVKGHSVQMEGVTQQATYIPLKPVG
jgi:NADH-quinone oxidoreductase subunit G